MRGKGVVGGWVLVGIAVSPLAAAAPSVTVPPRGDGAGPTPEQHRIASGAWGYFEHNFQPETCLYNSVDGYPSTTMWDTASAIAAIVAAHELGFLDARAFEGRLGCLLETLGTLPLVQGALPNKAYHTVTLEAVDYANNPGEIGVSAIDLGRLLIWLDVVKSRYPAFADLADRVVLRWTFCDVVDRGGTLYGALHDQGQTVWLQEGRLGYEEYAAAGFQLWGFDTTAASRMEPYEELGIYGVPIAYDARIPEEYGAHNYVITEPYLLLGLELNWDRVGDPNGGLHHHSDRVARTLARRVYRAQARRWRRTGILTARTEHHVEGPPYFVYDTVFSDGVAWATIGEDAALHPELATVSTRAAIGLDVLFDTRYTNRLVDAVAPLLDADRGLFEGILEQDGRPVDVRTANTNGIVLEAYLHEAVGKLVRDRGGQTLWDVVPNAEFPGIGQCLPRDLSR